MFCIFLFMYNSIRILRGVTAKKRACWHRSLLIELYIKGWKKVFRVMFLKKTKQKRAKKVVIYGGSKYSMLFLIDAISGIAIFSLKISRLSFLVWILKLFEIAFWKSWIARLAMIWGVMIFGTLFSCIFRKFFHIWWICAEIKVLTSTARLFVPFTPRMRWFLFLGWLGGFIFLIIGNILRITLFAKVHVAKTCSCVASRPHWAHIFASKWYNL